MITTKLGIVSATAIVGIAALALFESHLRVREENAALRRQLAELPRLSANGQRLSNLLVQAKTAQGTANDEYQELVRLRGQLSQLSDQSNLVNQARAQGMSNQVSELSALRSEVSGLSEEISELREAIEDLYASGSGSASGERSADANRATESGPASVRMISTRGETFAEKLKRSVSAQEGETFPEVFGRFLRINGVELSQVAGLAFDERTGRVIVRAPQSVLDQIERLVATLDGSP
jgi:type II secretory pathway component GspD/PulD (secretin)